MEKVKDILIKADKKARGGSGGGGWSFFGGGGDKLEEAADLYIEAANRLRLEKDLVNAGRIYEKAAETQLKTDAKDEAANTFVEAYKCYKTVDSNAAINALRNAIQHFSVRGNFRRAANYVMDLAALLEQESRMGEAIDEYEKAADWYSGDSAEALANKARLKIGEVAAMEKAYERAIQAYETVAKGSVNNPLTRFSIKDYFFRIGLCYLALGDTVATERAFEQFDALDMTFRGTREQELLAGLKEALQNEDPDEFAQKVADFDKVCTLDRWKTTMLLRIKDSMDEEPGLT